MDSLIIPDNVACHKSQGSKDYPLPNNIESFFLPAYSPDLNSIERLWKYFKYEFLNNNLFKTLANVKETVYECLINTIKSKDLIKSFCSI